MKGIHKLKTRPWCSPENTVEGKNYRFTVLTDSLLRLEYSRTGEFEDRATQTVWNRDFPKVSYTVKETEEQLELFTGILGRRSAISEAPRGRLTM